MLMHRTLMASGFAAALAVLAGCGGDDRQAPGPLELVIAKPDSLSGDQQVAVAGSTLSQELRVVVTHNDEPVEGVVVVWSTIEGSLTPSSDTTDADGVSSAQWTLQAIFAQQVAFAAIQDGAAPSVRFTAISTPDPEAANTVLVGAGGSNAFDPAEIAIAAGDTVNWLWPSGSSGHNVVPDDGDTPPHSGAPAAYPRFHSFRFEKPGVFSYHCATHGAVGGVGMSGTVTVRPRSDLQ
jgi:plastocyanin